MRIERILQRVPRSAVTSAVARAVLAVSVAAVSGTLFGAEPSSTAPASTQDRAAALPIAERIHDALAKRGTLEALIQELKAADPANPAVSHDLALASLEQGDLSDARQALTALAAAAPQDGAIDYLLSRTQEKCGDTDAAQQTLRTAISVTTDPARRTTLGLRLALLALDSGQTPEGLRVLDGVVKADPTAAAQASLIASFEGHSAEAARFMAVMPGQLPASYELFEGNAALNAGLVDAAGTAFAAALDDATDAQDRQYAQERVVAAARLGGQLSKLTDQWLARRDLSPAQLRPLATSLRELGRVPELLAWWRRQAADPRYQQTLRSPRFVAEVIGASQEAGRTDDAEAAARDMFARDPGDPSLTLLVELLLRDRKFAEADALLVDRLRGANEPDAVDRVVRLARSLGRDAVAIQAAQALSGFGGDNTVRGRLLEASVRRRAGDQPAAVALLREAAAAAAAHPSTLPETAAALEAAGLEEEAVRLLQADVAVARTDAGQERIAAMLIQLHRYADAEPVLENLRTNGTSVAVRAQAGQRLLDIAVAGRSVDRLIARTRAGYDGGHANAADLSLLVDAYVRSNKPDAAAELLASNTLLDRKTTLSRLVVLYLRTGKLAPAADTLAALVEADPEHAVGTLERLASVQLDRKQPAAAAAALDQIVQRVGRGSASFCELMAGIYDRLNRPEQAALFYRRVLADHPRNADTWLLWSTALGKARHAPQAVGRLQVLCDEAADENVFSLAVDGLLNLKAPPAALRAARRDAILRAAATPQKTMLFQVIGDLSDELQDPRAVVAALEAGVAFNREERPQLLREMIEIAGGKGLLDQANDCGRSLLALDVDFPPDLFLQLGERLLVAGRMVDASRAFARAADVASDDAVAPRAADLFEQFGHPDAALAALTPLADRKPSDLALRQKMARLDELTARNGEALDQYLAAIALAVRDLDARASSTDDPALNAAPPPDLAVLLNGAIAVARTPRDDQRIVSDLESIVRTHLEATPVAAKPSPLVHALATQVRRICLVLGQMEAADRIDASILRRSPDDRLFAAEATKARVDLGLYDAASRFAAVYGQQASLSPALRDALADSPTTRSESPGVDDAVVRLPRMLAQGDTAGAARLLKGVPLVLPDHPGATLPTLIAAAVTLGDDDLATQWATLWVRQIVRPGIATTGPTTAPARSGGSADSTAVQNFRNLVQGVWRVLPSAARREAALQAVELAERCRNGNNRSTTADFALRLCPEAGIDLPNRVEVALRVNPVSALFGAVPVSTELASRVCLLPPSDRPGFIQRALAELPPEFGLVFLQRVVAQSIEPFDAPTDAALVAAADALPARQVLMGSDWPFASMHKPVLPVLAEATLRSIGTGKPGEVDPSFPVAAAFALAGSKPARADGVARDAVMSYLASLSDPETTAARGDAKPATQPAARPGKAAAWVFPFGQRREAFVRIAVAAMSPAAREALRTTLATQQAGPAVPAARRAWSLIIQSVLLDAASRSDEALTALRSADAIGQADADVRQVYADRLAADGRQAELVESFGVSLVKPVPIRDAVANALIALFRGSEVRLPEKSVGLSAITPRRPLDFMTPWATNDWPRLGRTMRQFLERLRSNADGYAPIIEPEAGGLPRRDAGGDDAPTVLANIGLWDGAIEDILSNLRALPQGGHVAMELVSIVKAGAVDPAVAEQVVSRLMALQATGALTTNDRMLIERLAVVPRLRLPTALIGEIWNDMLFDPSGDPDYVAIAQCLRSQGDPHAPDVERWAAVRSQAGDPGVSRVNSRNVRRALPTPVGGVDETVVCDRVESLLDLDQIDAAERELATLRATGRATEQNSQCGLLWARVAAERGDLDAFVLRLGQAFDATACSDASQLARRDLSRVLPSRMTDATRRDAIAAAVAQTLVRAAERWPADTNWTRALAALGQWCHQQGGDAAAERTLAIAMSTGEKQGLGEHLLWTADLAKLLGHADASWSIQLKLLDTRCLPSTRIPAVVRYVQVRQGVVEARRLALNALAYCSEPNLVQWAASVASLPPMRDPTSISTQR